MDTTVATVTTGLTEILEQGRREIAEARRAQAEKERIQDERRAEKAAAYKACLVAGLKSIFPEPLHPFFDLSDIAPDRTDNLPTVLLRIPGLAPIRVLVIISQFYPKTEDFIFTRPDGGHILYFPSPDTYCTWEEVEDADKPYWNWHDQASVNIDHLPVVLACCEELGHEYAGLEKAHVAKVAELRAQQAAREIQRTEQATAQAQAKEPTVDDQVRVIVLKIIQQELDARGLL